VSSQGTGGPKTVVQSTSSECQKQLEKESLVRLSMLAPAPCGSVSEENFPSVKLADAFIVRHLATVFVKGHNEPGFALKQEQAETWSRR